MSAPTYRTGGYTTSLAARHLFSGILRPRQVMREAMNVGLGERGRIGIVWLSLWPILTSDCSIWRTFDDFPEQLAQYPDMYFRVFIVLFMVIAMSLTVVAAYFVLAIVAAVAMIVLRVPGRSFEAARSAVALGSWIMVLPTVISQLVAGTVLPEHMILADPPSVYSSIGYIVFAPYLAFCLAEAANSPLAQAGTVAVVAVLVVAVAVGASFQFGDNLIAASDAEHAPPMQSGTHAP